MNTSHIEILAPAGNFESLNAAINAGADSVFLGISDFNMRATAAKNFELNDLPKIRELTAQNNVKVYVTLNTVMYNSDLERLETILNAVKENNIDAVIASDMATIAKARSKDIEVHISTQLSISNTDAVKFYSDFSDRMVLARELTIEQVKQIVEDIKDQDIRGPRDDLIEVEIFAHGALCVAVSGRCGMSLFETGKSANRGECSQVCRREFIAVDKSNRKEIEIDNNYLMSSADLCTIGLLPLIVDSGAKVLKIEGRGRPPEYVDTVVTTYKKALKAIEDSKFNDNFIDQCNKELGTVFNRGQSLGLYMGRTFGAWAGTHGSKATLERIQVGEVTNFFSKINVAEIEVKHDEKLTNGDKLIFTGDTTGIVRKTFKDAIVDEIQVDEVSKGDVFTIKTDKKVRKGDQVYLLQKRKSYIPTGKEHFFKS